MGQMTGADIGELRDLARQMDRAAEHFDTVSRWLGQGLERSIWAGPDAMRFFNRCDHDLRVQLQRVAQALLDCARNLNQQADEQEEASSAGGGGTGGFSGRTGAQGFPGLGGAATGRVDGPGDTTDWGRTVLNAASNLDNLAGLYEAARSANVPSAGVVSGAFSVVGLVTGAMDVGEGLATQDEAMVVSGGVDVALSGAGLAAAGTVAAPLVGGLALGKALVDYSLPVTDADQYSLLDWQSQRMFGKPSDQLEVEQSNALTQRYTGPLGVAYMVSDKMDQSADELGRTVEGLGNVVGGSIGGALRWLGTAGR